jgi:ribosomal protein S18 acetylase RimI-like enzyme
MSVIRLHDRNRIEAHLRREPYLNLYGLGDLEPDQWPFTTWYGLAEDEKKVPGTFFSSLQALTLLYTRLSTPVLLALGGAADQPHLERLLGEIMPQLPPRFFAHLNLGLAGHLADRYRIESGGEHYKMAWMDRSRLAGVDTTGVVRLGSADAAEVSAFFAATYPGNFFEPAMLALGPWMALRDGGGRLVSVSGLHVCSPQTRVAALANVGTHPEHRGRGYARRVLAAQCRALAGLADHVGLNVRADNTAAIACYRSLGFEVAASYEECLVALHQEQA